MTTTTYRATQEFWYPSGPAKVIDEIATGNPAWPLRRMRQAKSGDVLTGLHPAVVKSALAKGWIVEVTDGKA